MYSVHLAEENNRTLQRRIHIYSHISYMVFKYCPVVGLPEITESKKIMDYTVQK